MTDASDVAVTALDAESVPPLAPARTSAARRFTRAPLSHSPRRAELPYRCSEGDPVAPPMTSGRRLKLALKRGMDLVLAAAGMMCLSPLLLLLWLAVRLSSPGPALFRQTRAGLNNRPFILLKFRTMHVDRGDRSGIAQTVAGDSRVTPLGRFLRRTSLDELPQLWNVLRGDMSLVGPRPHVFGMQAGGRNYDELVPYYAVRQCMRPGISGLAQVQGLRGPTDDPDRARARIDRDLAYIQNFSLRLDVQIILLTIWREFFRQGTGF